MTKRVPVRFLLVAVLHLIVLDHAAQAQFLPRSVVRVRMTPVIKDHLSGLAWNTLTEQCERIWSVEGVEIRWQADATGTPTPDDVTLPLVFDDREVRKHDPSRTQDAFGITLFSGRTQRVLVSIGRVRQLLAARRNAVDSDDSTVRDIAAGRLLGRVVAHELGHVLLLTTQHTADGLMSASLTGRNLGPFEPAHFALSLAERERLVTRFSVSSDEERRADASTTTPPSGSALGGAAIIPVVSRNVP